MADTEKKDKEELIIDGLRRDYPELADADDADLIKAVRQADFSDANDADFSAAMDAAYAPGAKHEEPFSWKQTGKDIAEGFTGLGSGVGQSLGAMASNYGSALTDMQKVGYSDLIKRGYSPQIAQHVMQQRIGTENEMAGEEQQIGEEGQKATANSAANYASLALGAKMDTAMAGIAKKGLAKYASHVLSGAAGMSSFNMLLAMGEGKGADAVMKEGLKGAGIGAAFGGIAPGVIKVAEAVNPFKGAAQQLSDEIAMGAIHTPGNSTLKQRAEDFAEHFNPMWLRTRFSYMPEVIDQTTGNFRSTDARYIAARLINDNMGSKVAANTSESAVAKIADKIEKFRQPMLPTDFSPPMDPISQMQGMMGNNIPAEYGPRQAIDTVVESNKMQQPGFQAPQPNMLGGGMGPARQAESNISNQTSTALQSPMETAAAKGTPPGPLETEGMSFSPTMNPGLDPSITHPTFVPPDQVEPLAAQVKTSVPEPNPMSSQVLDQPTGIKPVEKPKVFGSAYRPEPVLPPKPAPTIATGNKVPAGKTLFEPAQAAPGKVPGLQPSPPHEAQPSPTGLIPFKEFAPVPETMSPASILHMFNRLTGIIR